ncbi:MAG: hypothetical protein IKY23_04775 [Lachnospiraceae bacterium]|nr:hypothetical protein [Lachnospiraceae bacterium]
MIRINLAEELKLYNLEGKWNDYIGAQKEILQVLRKELFFDSSNVVNKESGLLVKISSKGIRETIGNGNRFQILPQKLKQYKIATIRYLPELIETGYVICANMENSHDKTGYRYAYIGNKVCIDNEEVGIRISIKKKIDTNHFWIHNVDTNKNSELLSPFIKRS